MIVDDVVPVESQLCRHVIGPIVHKVNNFQNDHGPVMIVDDVVPVESQLCWHVIGPT
jgi:hypothetical protein